MLFILLSIVCFRNSNIKWILEIFKTLDVLNSLLNSAVIPPDSWIFSYFKICLLYNSQVCYCSKFKRWPWMTRAKVISKQRYSSSVRKALELNSLWEEWIAKWVILIKFSFTDIRHVMIIVIVTSSRFFLCKRFFKWKHS